MTAPFFFGYGSLVNRATHIYDDAHPATLKGWRRVWRHTDILPRPFLTIERCEGVEIEGLIAHVPGGDWAALDERETGYDREPVTEAVTHTVTRPLDIATYSIPEGKHHRPTEDLPIALSYLDVVVQGYLQEFGEAGARAFFETTRGWDAPIHDDRADPFYPRHQILTADERAFVDAQLAAVGGRVITTL